MDAQGISMIDDLPISSILKDNLNDFGSILQAFTAAFSVIIISELGDKTFIIAAIMSMENSRVLVFLASSGALILMTILSVIMGVAVTIIPKLYTHYASMILFLCFGLRMLHEAFMMQDEDADSEFDEVKKSLEEEKRKQKGMKIQKQILDTNNNEITSPVVEPEVAKKKQKWLGEAGPLVIQVFTMNFLAEWGDRSQISTVVLAARENAIGVLAGALLGHILCTGLAVLAGRFVSNLISVRTMTYLGGITFLGFSLFAIVFGPE